LLPCPVLLQLIVILRVSIDCRQFTEDIHNHPIKEDPTMSKLLIVLLFTFGSIILSDVHASNASSSDRQLALQQIGQALSLTASELEQIELTDIYRTQHNGVLHVYFRQQIDGIPIVNAPGNLNIDRNGKRISAHSRLITDLSRRSPARTPLLPAEHAVQALAADRGLPAATALQSLDSTNQTLRFLQPQWSLEPIKVDLVYRLQAGELRLAWAVELNSMHLDNNWWHGWVDSQNGRVLAVENWVDDASYRVFEAPKEAPMDGPETLAVDPENAVASPLGWHDDGNTQFTDTRGNNVLAQEDTDANNSGGRRPDGGVGLVFDFPLDLDSQDPPQYEDFAISNLFYWNNVVHDVLYQYGFDEASGNFQSNNFGLGGNGGDAVRADAQDGSGTNNANFGTPPDGFAPRMQMFIWTGTNPALLQIDSPAAIAGDYSAAAAEFGSPIDATGINGTLELVNDGGTSPSEGCGPLSGFTAGNIAVVDRGSCEFGAKGVNAQNAGAIGMIVVNNASGNGTLSMGAGAQGNSVSIPAAMIGNDDGLIIRAELSAAVTGSLSSPNGPGLDRDSDLDAGVIAHEYGHGLSNRLTGGPANSSCLFGSEQQGEGWSDYLALVFTHEDGDSADTPRGVGRYLIFQENNPSAGIRPFPYTRNMDVNPLTYGDIVNAGQIGSPISIPHGVGTVWNTMLWDMYWNLIDKHGFDPDIYNGSGGNNIAIQTVLDGLKLQPCGPTFVSSRDALLEADLINNGGANECEIWEAFARRGVGFSASDGGGPGTLAVNESFDLPSQCAPLQEVFLIDGFEDASAQ